MLLSGGMELMCYGFGLCATIYRFLVKVASLGDVGGMLQD